MCRHTSKLVLDTNLLLSPEFRELETKYSAIKDLGNPPYKAITKDGQKEMATTSDLLAYVFETGERGSPFSGTRVSAR